MKKMIIAILVLLATISTISAEQIRPYKYTKCCKVLTEFLTVQTFDGKEITNGLCFSKNEKALFNLNNNYRALTCTIISTRVTNDNYQPQKDITVNFYLDGILAESVSVFPNGPQKDFELDLKYMKQLKMEVVYSSKYYNHSDIALYALAITDIDFK